MEKSLFEEYSVLLAEEPKIRANLFESWLSEISTRSVSSVADLGDHVDATVAVACLSQSLLGDNEEMVRKQLLATNPYCQLILVVPRATTFIAPFEDQYDACLSRPVFKEELQTTVEERLKYGTYSALLREFYHLNMKLIGIQETETPPESATDMDPTTITQRLHKIRTQLHQLQNELDGEAISEIIRSLDLHEQYLREPDRDRTATKQSKYHPPRCPQCKLSWGVDHGNELKAGFESVGAHVWKCRKCDNIVHSLGESHRHVTPH